MGGWCYSASNSPSSPRWSQKHGLGQGFTHGPRCRPLPQSDLQAMADCQRCHWAAMLGRRPQEDKGAASAGSDGLFAITVQMDGSGIRRGRHHGHWAWDILTFLHLLAWSHVGTPCPTAGVHLEISGDCLQTERPSIKKRSSFSLPLCLWPCLPNRLFCPCLNTTPKHHIARGRSTGTTASPNH